MLPELYRPLMKAVARFHSCGVNHNDIHANNIVFASSNKPTCMVVIDFGCAGIRQTRGTKKEWANSGNGDVGQLQISLEKRLGTKLNNDGTLRSSGNADYLRGLIPFFRLFSCARKTHKCHLGTSMYIPRSSEIFVGCSSSTLIPL